VSKEFLYVPLSLSSLLFTEIVSGVIVSLERIPQTPIFFFTGQKRTAAKNAYEQIRVEEMGARPCSTVRRQDYKSVHFFRGWVGVRGSRAPVTFVVLVVVALISRRSAHLGVFDGRHPAGSDGVGV